MSRFGPDVYRIPVGVNATCDEKRRHLQGVMPEGMLGQGCTNARPARPSSRSRSCSRAARPCEAAMGDAKLERTSTVEPGALWRGSPGGAVTSLKGQRFEAVARAFLGAHGYASAGGAASPSRSCSRSRTASTRSTPTWGRSCSTSSRTPRRASGRRPPGSTTCAPWAGTACRARTGSRSSRRAAWRRARRALEAVTGHVRFNFLGGRGTDASTRLARGWVERFALAHFRADDVLVFTDSWQAHAPLGPFDRTLDAAQPKWNPKLANNVSFIRDAMTSPARDEWVAHLMFLGRGRPPPPTRSATSRRTSSCAWTRATWPRSAPRARRSRRRATTRGRGASTRPSSAAPSPSSSGFEHAGRTDADLELGYRYHVYDPAKPASAYGYERDWATRNWHLGGNHRPSSRPRAWRVRMPRTPPSRASLSKSSLSSKHNAIR